MIRYIRNKIEGVNRARGEATEIITTEHTSLTPET